jgi:glycerol-3-phosphate O-acyltransferase/dihydroxyacetone phosphate acyltransferase
VQYRNIRINPFLRLIYLFLRFTAWVGTGVYYRKRLVLGRKNLRFDGPAIVISNHPSTLTDVLNVALPIRQEMFYLANYSLFKNPVSNWILSRLYCIPVKRKEDVAEGEVRDNEGAFEQSFRHLEQNGILFIAPEGVSWMNRFVRPLKTGTARIALGTEARNHWKMGIKIIPVGVSYSQPNHFRSEVVVQAGAPVYPRDWIEQWQKDPEAATNQLTEFLENQLKSLSIHTRDEQGELFITRLETLLKNEDPLPQQEAYERSKALTAKCLDDTALQTRVQTYFDQLEVFDLSDEGIEAVSSDLAGTHLITDGLRIALGFPFFLSGYICWFLPCFLPWLLAKRLKLYIGYDSNVKILAGLFTFPLAMWGMFRVFRWWFEAPSAWIGLLCCAVLGLFAERYMDVLRRFQARQKAAVKAAKDPAGFSRLVQMRSAILVKLQTGLK